MAWRTSVPIGVGSTYDDFEYVASCEEDATERLKLMLDEEGLFVPGNYMASVQTDGMEKEWRNQIVEWFFQLSDYYSFSRETAALAIALLDRFMATTSVNSLQYQLAALTCLFIAIKYNERIQPKAQKIVTLAHGKFLPEHMRMMEQKILSSVGWRVNYPTPMCLIRAMLTYLNALPETTERIILDAQYLTELATSGKCIAALYIGSLSLFIRISIYILTCTYILIPHRRYFKHACPQISRSSRNYHPA